jgi:hypothetical protein
MRDSKNKKHEYGLLGAAVYMILATKREYMCQLVLLPGVWGTRHLISPELAVKDAVIHNPSPSGGAAWS